MESQMESAHSDLRSEKKGATEAESPEARRKRDSLLLARKRVLSQIQTSTDARYREMMDRALADLDRLLAQIH